MRRGGRHAGLALARLSSRAARSLCRGTFSALSPCRRGCSPRSTRAPRAPPSSRRRCARSRRGTGRCRRLTKSSGQAALDAGARLGHPTSPRDDAYSAVLRCAPLCSAVLRCAPLCSAVLRCAPLCSAVSAPSVFLGVLKSCHLTAPCILSLGRPCGDVRDASGRRGDAHARAGRDATPFPRAPHVHTSPAPASKAQRSRLTPADPG